MPGHTVSADSVSILLGAVDRLPDIAGLSPELWTPILFIATVFCVFLFGNPSSRRR